MTPRADPGRRHAEGEDRDQPDPREPRTDDGERNRGQGEVVEPDDRGEQQGGRDEEPEAAPAPGHDEHREARRESDHTCYCSGDAGLGEQPVRRVPVLVERVAEPTQEPRVLEDADEGQEEQEGRRGNGRRDSRLQPPTLRREPEGERPDEELQRDREAEHEPGIAVRSRVLQTIATSRQRIRVRCAVRISPITGPQSEAAP